MKHRIDGIDGESRWADAARLEQATGRSAARWPRRLVCAALTLSCWASVLAADEPFSLLEKFTRPMDADRAGKVLAEAPRELQGVWLVYAFSNDEGRTVVQAPENKPEPMFAIRAAEWQFRGGDKPGPFVGYRLVSRMPDTEGAATWTFVFKPEDGVFVFHQPPQGRHGVLRQFEREGAGAREKRRWLIAVQPWPVAPAAPSRPAVKPRPPSEVKKEQEEAAFMARQFTLQDGRTITGADVERHNEKMKVDYAAFILQQDIDFARRLRVASENVDHVALAIRLGHPDDVIDWMKAFHRQGAQVFRDIDLYLQTPGGSSVVPCDDGRAMYEQEIWKEAVAIYLKHVQGR